MPEVQRPFVIDTLLSRYRAYGQSEVSRFIAMFGGGPVVDAYLVAIRHPLAELAGRPEHRALLYILELAADA